MAGKYGADVDGRHVNGNDVPTARVGEFPRVRTAPKTYTPGTIEARSHNRSGKRSTQALGTCRRSNSMRRSK